MREGLRDADIQRLAALVRGGASFEQAAAEISDVNPAVLLRFSAHVIELAKEPGSVARTAPPATDRDDLTALRRLFPAEDAPAQFNVMRSTSSR